LLAYNLDGVTGPFAKVLLQFKTTLFGLTPMQP
jgi:hypothetical protein